MGSSFSPHPLRQPHQQHRHLAAAQHAAADAANNSLQPAPRVIAHDDQVAGAGLNLLQDAIDRLALGHHDLLRHHAGSLELLLG